MTAPTRPWRARLVAVIAGTALTVPAFAGQAAAAPAGPAGDDTARAVATKVASEVRTKVDKDGTGTFWVVLDRQAELTTAQTKTTKAEKAAEVYRTKTEFAKTSQAGLRQLLDSEKADYQAFWISNRIQVKSGDKKLLEAIATRSEVARIEADKAVELPKPIPGSAPLAEVNGVEWNIDRINAPRVWNELGVRGEGIVVANIDTGVHFTHPALAGKYRGKRADGSADHNYNWFDPSRVCAGGTPCDNNGHGTHTMGTMVGDEGTNQIGVAPGATWVAAKGCESSSCSEAALLAAGEWIVAPTDLNRSNPRPDLAPDVVNNSWGSNGFDPWYTDIVNSWVAAGIFPSFASGNPGASCGAAGSPGNYTVSHATGAFDINGAIASFSGRGPGRDGLLKPDLAAPGVNVRSSVPNGYAPNSGTSMAAPHTTAVVGLMWSASPALRGNIAETRRLLDQTAVDTSDLTCGGTPTRNNVWGEGKLDAFRAVSAVPRGPLGALGGTITSGGQPLAGATVVAGGPIDRTTTTGADGKYHFPNMPVGDYRVKASKFGYSTATGSATVTEGATATLDLSVAQAPSATLSGTVSTGAGPAAGAVVELVGTPLSATADAQGRYSIIAPTGEYDVKVSHTSLCSGTVTQRVVLNADTTHNVTLPDRTDTYGYACGGGATSPYPTVTNKLDLIGDDVTKDVTLPFPIPLYGSTYTTANISANGVVAFAGGSNAPSNTTLPSPFTPNGALYPFWDDFKIDEQSGVYTGVVGAVPHRAYVVEWRNVVHFADANLRQTFAAIISEDGSVVFRYKDVTPNSPETGTSATIGLENATGTDGFQYSFNQAVVTDGMALSFRTTKSGVVRGTVTDANDTKPVVGAKVTIKSGDTVVATTQSGADGGYLVQVATGTLTVTAEATHYETRTATVNLAAGAVASVNNALRTARVEATPTPLEIVVPTGGTRTRALKLSNTGSFDTPYTVAEAAGGEPGDVPWLGVVGGSGNLRAGGTTTAIITISSMGLTPGTFHDAELRITSNSGRNPVLTVPVRIVVPGFQTAIDAGNTRSHIDALGDTWTPDKAFKKGACGYLGASQTKSTNKTIHKTDDQIRFSDAREGMYEYRCDGLADGVYTVELDFAELTNNRPNKRIFDVMIEGVEVVPNLDLSLEAGNYTAHNRTFTVRVTDGQLNVRFITHTGFSKPTINALRVTHRPDKAPV